MAAPHSITTGPVTLYLAPTGETFPAIDATPAGNWEVLGTAGDRDIAEGGVTVTYTPTLMEIMSDGSSGPRDARITAESLVIEGEIIDSSLEELAKLLNDVAVTDTAPGSGVAGHRSITIYKGVGQAARFALLIRGESPYMDARNLQIELPVVYQSGPIAPVYVKGEPVKYAFSFTALEDPDAGSAATRFGRFRAQDADGI